MAKSALAFINPDILVWAREQAGLTIEAAAEGIAVSADKLAKCEAGDDHLTFPQFLKAANFYKRAPALFYLDERPQGFQPIQDFRHLHDAEVAMTPALEWAIRQARERRELALELRQDVQEPVSEFTLRAALTDNVEAVGQAIRDYLGIQQSAQQGWRAKALSLIHI